MVPITNPHVYKVKNISLPGLKEGLGPVVGARRRFVREGIRARGPNQEAPKSFWAKNATVVGGLEDGGMEYRYVPEVVEGREAEHPKIR